MKKPYKVNITETLSRTVVIYAEDEDEAYNYADKLRSEETIGLEDGGRDIVVQPIQDDEVKNYQIYTTHSHN